MKLFECLAGRSAREDHSINDSLASSFGISDRLGAWSGSSARDRPFPMFFHSEWRHPSCPVMAWYINLQPSSTRFRSIEHRKSTVKPFYHEFLLLKLTDGAVCRLERFGNGSHADAIRWIGCKSHDLVQWYSQSDAAKATGDITDGVLDRSTLNSELVAEVDFGREFDILDVLAVCYSVRRIKRCNVYTLQRYNCYFLCLTVLAVLVRRVASWETVVTNNVWASVVQSTTESFTSRPPSDPERLLFVRMCDALEPDNSRAAQPTIRLLPEYLAPESCIPTSCVTSIATTLWEFTLKADLEAALQEILEPQVRKLLSETQGHSAAQLNQSVCAIRSDVQREILHDQRLADFACNMLVDNLANAGLARLRALVVWMEIWPVEQYPTLADQMLFKLVNLLWSPSLQLPMETGDDLMLHKILLNPTNRFRLFLAYEGKETAERLGFLENKPDSSPLYPDTSRPRLGRWLNVLLAPVLVVLATLPFEATQFIGRWVDTFLKNAALGSTIPMDMQPSLCYPYNKRFGEKLCHSQIISYYEAILSAHASFPLTSAQLTLLFSLMLSPSLCACLLAQCVSLSLVQLMNKAFESEHTYLIVSKPSQNQTPVPAERMTCAQFQNAHILPRIEEHAKRVGGVLLAEYSVVYEDITMTMTHVWQMMPSGFGAATGKG